ncbi:unnamed protein product [Symbiodinium necroappetens]|uniref:Uncharacterized protein n=1 Tax=Symbiodinium necroappetens TaxID=1628268 RepID=A0A813AMK1_9DINO|nr:unnamed protein product [Symbiodinium necroappetens]
MAHSAGSAEQSQKRRRQLARVTSIDSCADPEVSVEHCAPGVRNAEDLAHWPLDVVRSVCRPEDDELTLRLMHRLRCGIQLSSDYSGLDAPRECLEMGVQALQHELQIEGGLLDAVLVTRTCDKAALPTRVQVEMSRFWEQGRRCHFQDILDRLPEQGREYINAAKPEKSARKQARMDAYAAITDWVMKNRSWLFSVDAESYCAVHERQCKVHKTLAVPDGRQSSGNQSLRINVAGVTCHAWSTEGSLEGNAHESEVPLSVWLAERVFMFENDMEDACFLECTPRFPAQRRLEDAFGDVAFVFSWVDAAEWHGWPNRRKRILACAVNKRTAVWHGDGSVLELQKDYSKRFYRQMAATGELLFQATTEDRLQEMVGLAVARKNNVSLAEMQQHLAARDAPKVFSLLLPPGGIVRMKDWMQLFQDKKRECPELRAFLCDVDHIVGGKGPCGGELWPTQLTHGHVMAFSLGETEEQGVSFVLATAQEHLLALGWRTFGVSSIIPKSKLCAVIDNLKLSSSHIKQLAGNSMNLRTQLAFMLYAIANVSRKKLEDPRMSRMSSWCEFDEAEVEDSQS